MNKLREVENDFIKLYATFLRKGWGRGRRVEMEREHMIELFQSLKWKLRDCNHHKNQLRPR